MNSQAFLTRADGCLLLINAITGRMVWAKPVTKGKSFRFTSPICGDVCVRAATGDAPMMVWHVVYEGETYAETRIRGHERLGAPLPSEPGSWRVWKERQLPGVELREVPPPPPPPRAKRAPPPLPPDPPVADLFSKLRARRALRHEGAC